MPIISETQARSGSDTRETAPIAAVAGGIGNVDLQKSPNLLRLRDDPTFGQAFAASLRLGGFYSGVLHEFENMETFAKGRRAVKEGTPAKQDPNYDPYEHISGYEPWAKSFVNARDESDVTRIKTRIDRELQDRDTLSRAGWTGFAASFASGLLDPVMLLPFGQVAKLFKVAEPATRLISVLRGAAKVGFAGFAASTADEVLAHRFQETRTLTESATNIAATTFISGILGAGISLFTPLKTKELAKGVSKHMEIPPDNVPDVATEPGSVMLTMKSLEADTGKVVPEVPDAQIQLSSALGLEKIAGAKGAARIVTSPIMRTATSVSKATRRAAQQLAETPFYYEGNALGIASPIAAETKIKLWDAPLAESIEFLDEAYAKFKQRKVEGPKTFKEFREEVGKAMRKGDTHEVAEVAQTAKRFRAKLFEPLKERAIKAGLLPADVKVETAASYLTRIYNVDKIALERPRFRGIVTEWLKGQVELPLKELEDTADNVIDTIMHSPNGRVPYDLPPIVRGPLRERTFNIPDELIEDFLESDIEIVSRYYKRTMAPDVEIADRFGSVDMKQQIMDIRNEYRERIGKVDPKDTKTVRGLEKRMEGDIADIAGMRDRLRGTFHEPSDPNGFTVRASSVIRNLNYLGLMGQVTISSIPDLARTPMVNGMWRTFKNGIVPLVRNFRAFRLSAEEGKLAAAGLDLVMNSRAQSLFDIGDTFGRRTFAETGIRKLTNTYNLVNLMAPWNAALKQFASVVTQARILDAAEAFQKGKIAQAELRKLAMSGIDKDMALRIAKQFTTYGTEQSGAKIANTANWVDREAMQAFRAAVLKDVEIQIVTPGAGDTPLWMSSNFGRIAGQFKSFTFASVQRMMIMGLQQRDMAAMNGLALSVGLGMTAFYLKEQLAGRELPEDPMRWIAKGVENSGVMGWLFDANEIVSRGTRGTFTPDFLENGPVRSRYSSNDLVKYLLGGPTLSRMEDMARVLGAAASGDVNAGDVRAARRLVPYQNLFYIRRLFDKGEEAVNEELGNE